MNLIVQQKEEREKKRREMICREFSFIHRSIVKHRILRTNYKLVEV